MPKKNQIIVSNTTPIISLSLINKLDLLHSLYGEVWIPPAVENEIIAGGTRAGANELLTADYIRTVPLIDTQRADLLSDLDRGEAEAIALALEQNAERILIDERLGRRHAQRLGLSVTGVLGILLRAKTESYIDTIEPLIKVLLEGDIRFSKTLVERALKMAGER